MLTLAASQPDSPVGGIGEGGHAFVVTAHTRMPTPPGNDFRWIRTFDRRCEHGTPTPSASHTASHALCDIH